MRNLFLLIALCCAHLLEEAGCFAIVLEKIPATLAERVASELTIPIIGIGAGGHVDGQVLVIQDMLGMNNGFRPRFLRRYADLYTVMTDAIKGANVTHEAVRQMLKNWKRQGLINILPDSRYQKVASTV